MDVMNGETGDSSVASTSRTNTSIELIMKQKEQALQDYLF